MPFESIAPRDLSTSSCFLEEICFPSEKEIGFWKAQTMHYSQDGIHGKFPIPHSKSVVSSPLEKLFPASVGCLELPRSPAARDRKIKYDIGGEEQPINFLRASEEYINCNQKANPNLYLQAMSCSVETSKTYVKETQSGDSLSSSTLSDVFGRKLGLSLNNGLFHKSADAVASCHEEEEPFGSMEEMEAQTIGDLLPDEDNLFSEVIGELDYVVDAKGGDDAEDFDLFSSVGGMELEVEDVSCAGQEEYDFNSGVTNGGGSSNGSLAATHPYGEHPSRTLFVRNISSHVEDSELRVLFERYGDVRNLYTTCKHRGFVMISYFDIRAATNAMRALQNKQLGHRKLDIHYSIPKDNPSGKDINQGAVVVCNVNSSVSNDDLRQIFRTYGEIKEIREIPHKRHHKLMEFYDVRAAEAACCALTKYNNAGKQINLEPSCLQDIGQRVMQKCYELEQDEAGLSKSCNCISSSESMLTVAHGGRTIGCCHDGIFQGLHSVDHVPLNALTENMLSHGSSCGQNSSPSLLSVASSGNHIGIHNPSHSVKCIPSSHPHSFPDCQDNFDVFIPHNSASPVANMTDKIGLTVSDRINGRHTNMVVPNGQPMELKGGVSGPSDNVTCPVRRHHLSNSNRFQIHPSSPMAWPSSPLFRSGVSAHFAPQLPALSGMPPEVQIVDSPAHPLHGGSAPSSSPSVWNRQHVYTGECPEDLAFCLGSLGAGGFPGSSSFHLSGRASHVFSRAGGNCVEKSAKDALYTPHWMSNICTGKNTVTSLPISFGYPHECGRNLSHRRTQGSSSHADKKQFELDTDRILREEDSRTTLMIKNIPNKYTSKMLLTTIDEHCQGTYDFIYLPIDFKNKCNVGYAFINLIDPLQIIPFYKAFNGKRWEKFNSEKVAVLAYARIQGKAALVAHFQNSSLMNEDKRCRPILFCTDGPNAGEQEPFPMGTNIRSKAGKARSSITEEIYHHGSPSTTANRWGSCGSATESY